MIDERERDENAAFEDAEGEDAETAPPADPEEVRALAERLLQGLGLSVEVVASGQDATIEVDLRGADRDLLLARKGEGLSAVQYLLNRIVYRGRKGRKIHVDSEGFRKQRDDEIGDIALRAAEKAKETGEPCVLSPLNPYERRLVHLALRDVEGVDTRSLGDGFLKRVSIIPGAKKRPVHDEPSGS